MTVAQTNLDDGSSISGTLYLVDLAGSEKVAKTNVKGTQLDEAKGINKSLSTLGKVINALTDKKQTHIPYRESKLTRILTESLGGNAKTCLIITCSPAYYNYQETISTLRFGTAARNIKNKPKINREYTVDELKRMVTKRDKIIKAYENRVEALEEFLKSNNLEMPTDEALENLTMISEKVTEYNEDVSEAPDSDYEIDIPEKEVGLFKETNLLNYSQRDKEDLKEPEFERKVDETTKGIFYTFSHKFNLTFYRPTRPLRKRKRKI